MRDSDKPFVLSPLAEDALGYATDIQAAEFLQELREQKHAERTLEEITENHPSELIPNHLLA